MMLSELYLQMGKLIIAAVLMIFGLMFLQLLLDEGIDWIRDRAEDACDRRRRRAAYAKLAKKHGRRVMR